MLYQLITLGDLMKSMKFQNSICLHCYQYIFKPYTWWVSNKRTYPNIFKLVLKFLYYLSPPSSRVYSSGCSVKLGTFVLKNTAA